MPIEKAPGGLDVLSGGTRISVILDRPWQSDLTIRATNCPLDLQNSNGVQVAPGWQVADNPYTPLTLHKLIMPTECWPKERVRSLGGATEIAAALEIATRLNAPDGHRWVGVHVGATAGQNQSHLHYHLIHLPGAIFPKADLETIARADSNTIFETGAITAAVAGFRAGQCFLLPSRASSARIEPYAAALNRLIQLYSKAFISDQGLPPDFSIVTRLVGEEILYGMYIPILNQWGFTEYLALIEKTPIVLPWPHEETVRRLRKHAQREEDVGKGV